VEDSTGKEVLTIDVSVNIKKRVGENNGKKEKT